MGKSQSSLKSVENRNFGFANLILLFFISYSLVSPGTSFKT